MRNGLFVGIPLTLLQIGVHRHTGGLVDPYLVVNNFLLANAVYDADRIEGDMLAPERMPTRISGLCSSAFFASDASTTVTLVSNHPSHRSNLSSLPLSGYSRYIGSPSCEVETAYPTLHFYRRLSFSSWSRPVTRSTSWISMRIERMAS